MNRYSFNQTQLYALLLFSGAIPVLTLVLGFHLAWQYHDGKALANGYPVVLSDQVVQRDISHELNAAPDAMEIRLTENPQIETQADASAETSAKTAEPIKNAELIKTAQIAASPTITSETDNPPSMPVSGAGSDTQKAFALQLAAFQDKQRAIAWATKQKQQHDNVHLLKREIDGKTFYTVAVGHFEEKSAAKSAQHALTSARGVSSYVIEYRQNAEEIILSS